MKLNLLLAKTDSLQKQFVNLVKDYVKFFSDKQGSFKGIKKTYTPAPDTVDDPKLRETRLVVTTVEEKLSYLEETTSEYIDAVFSQEATNASGNSKAILLVDDISFGEYSSLELMRLKNILENTDLNSLYNKIPVREDSKNWSATTEPEYEGRDVYEDEKMTGENKTTEKESYILTDPNLKNLSDGSKYQPQIAQKNTTRVLGTFTQQNFTGEYSHVKRAHILKRRNTLLTAVNVALKQANECEVVKSQMTAKRLFSYLHDAKLT
jgi:hypothetical protein